MPRSRIRIRTAATALAALLAGAVVCGAALTVGAFSNDGEFVHENPNSVQAAPDFYKWGWDAASQLPNT